MTTALLDVEGFKERTVMPAEDVDALELKYPNFLTSRLKINTSLIYARLAKRYGRPYAIPFTTNPPDIVLGWLVAMTTPEAYKKRGWNSADKQAQDIIQDKTDALEQQKEAADAENGLFDIPLQEGSSSSGISVGGAIGYSEPSPYDWMDRQAEAIDGT